jgi:hypothetical protein
VGNFSKWHAIAIQAETVMIPKFHNPHVLFQQTEPITREELGFLQWSAPSTSTQTETTENRTSTDEDLAWLESYVQSNISFATPSSTAFDEDSARARKKRRVTVEQEGNGAGVGEAMKCSAFLTSALHTEH